MGKVALAVVLLVVVIVPIGTVFTSSNTVPPTFAGQAYVAVGPNELKPRECAGITVTNLILVESVLNTGTEGNDLLIGNDLVSVIDGAGGDDCLVTGNTAAVLQGGDGYDVCVGRQLTVMEACESEVIRTLGPEDLAPSTPTPPPIPTVPSAPTPPPVPTVPGL